MVAPAERLAFQDERRRDCMARALRGLRAPAAMIVCAAFLAGCESRPNEGSAEISQGTASANAPVSQKEFYEQQQAQVGTPGKKSASKRK